MSRDLVRIWSRRSRAGFAGVAAVLLALTACGGSSGSSGGTKTYTIAFISQGTSNSWAAQLDAVARKTAKADGIKLVYFNGQGDATKQLPEIDTAIAQKPDAIVLVPLGGAADTGPVERAMGQNIKVILCDSTITSTNYTSLVTPHAETATVPLAQWLADKMNHQGNLLYIGGLPGNTTTTTYDQGFNSVMQKYPDIHIINAGNANYSISTAKQLAATAIASGRTFAGAWGVGGEAVTGMMQAYVDAGVTSIPPIGGNSATNGTMRLAIQHTIQVASLQFPPTSSQVCIDTAFKAAKGESVPKSINLSDLPQYGPIFPPLDKYYKSQYSDDMYVGTDSVLTFDELKAINLVK
ncbi:MAG: sugar ABC transporter substrate-binding protein [Chloroflexi bacterium]|nr:MAG: sugar ABC transporter substrate-binding protein [Chloroflexota bacterium]TMF94810.1 MAG: sugar ABC transporter substrate-binding protein [Chloroflexota bacterium]TMG43455.1 MAG: sugar ABC transporter substrate-binding protein [Chloroflexota bacterium]